LVNPDVINGGMEFFSAVIMLLNVRRLWIDKNVAGVSLVSTLFFDTWGFWNLYYYAAIEQPWSWWGGLCLTLVNLAWMVLAFRCTYWPPERRQTECICEPPIPGCKGWPCSPSAYAA
jgi:hypothetical protein